MTYGYYGYRATRPQPTTTAASRIPTCVQGRIIGAGDVNQASRMVDRAALRQYLRQPSIYSRMTYNARAVFARL